MDNMEQIQNTGSQEKGKEQRFPAWKIVLFYVSSLVIGLITSRVLLLSLIIGPTLGFLVIRLTKPLPKQVAKRGAIAGGLAAVGVLWSLLGLFLANVPWDYIEFELYYRLIAAVYIFGMSTATAAFIGRARPVRLEVPKREITPGAEPQFLTIEAEGNFLKFICPSCRKTLQVNTSSFLSLSGSTQNDIPQVRNSGHYRKVPTRSVNILVYFLVVIGAGICSGNIIVSVIAGLVAMATSRLWGGWIVNAFGKSVPIWIITCPECQSKIGSTKYADTVKDSFEIINKPLSEEEIRNL